MVGITYLLKYTDQFSIVSIFFVAIPLLMYKCFGSINEVDSHNKSHQLDLALDKFLVMKCGWLRLCTTVATGLIITNCWKLFFYGVKRNSYDKFIGVREFSSIIAFD